MTRASGQEWGMRPGLLALLFCALLLRSFVPGGYMIGAAVGGGPALILCPDAGPMPAGHGGHHKSDAPKHSESPCPYGALAAPVLPPAPPVLLTALPPAIALPAPAGETAFASPPLAAPPPPSTGPPASA